MKPHLVSGNIAGLYRTQLAASSLEYKSLSVILSIDEDNGWSINFEVRVGEMLELTQMLSRAIRIYDTGPENKAKP